MEGWKTDKFKNQIQYKSGYTWSKEQERKVQEPLSVRVLTVTNIQKELDLSEELYLQSVSDKDKKEKAVSKDWCIAVSSNGNRKRIGNAVFIKDDTDYLFASFLTAFKPKENSDILPNYFFRWLSSHDVQERITSVSEGTTGLGNLDIRFLRNMDILYPEKHEQSAIAAKLSKVDEAIAAVQGSIAAAERLKKSLMQNLLTGRMKPDGTLRNEDEFYVDEKFGKVPVGWVVKKLKNIADIQRGKFGHRPRNDERFYNGEYPFVQTNDVVESVFYLKKASQTLNELGISVSKCFPSGTIIMTIAANIGFVAITNYKVYFPDSLIGINANEQIILSTYMLLQLMGYKNILDAQATESAQKNINYSNLFPLLIPYPTDKQEQKQIVERIKKVFDTIENKQNKIAVLERLKKSLMQNLLTGKVRVNKE